MSLSETPRTIIGGERDINARLGCSLSPSASFTGPLLHHALFFFLNPHLQTHPSCAIENCFALCISLSSLAVANQSPAIPPAAPPATPLVEPWFCCCPNKSRTLLYHRSPSTRPVNLLATYMISFPSISSCSEARPFTVIKHSPACNAIYRHLPPNFIVHHSRTSSPSPICT